MSDNDNGEDFEVPISAVVKLGKKRSGAAKAKRVDAVDLRALNEQESVLPVTDVRRPRTRDECIDGLRPCPFVSCQFHLYLDADKSPWTGNASIKFNFPDRDPLDLKETCALDVADRGPVGLQEVGDLLNVSRERVRQIEERALRKVRIEIERRRLRRWLRAG